MGVPITEVGSASAGRAVRTVNLTQLVLVIRKERRRLVNRFGTWAYDLRDDNTASVLCPVPEKIPARLQRKMKVRIVAHRLKRRARDPSDYARSLHSAQFG
jgi:hypothetical protein